MLTLTRRQARTLRAAFRRHALGCSPRGAAPPLVLVADAESGIRARCHITSGMALACQIADAAQAPGTVALPLEALADLEGRDDSPIALEPAGPGRTVARWHDRGLPRSREYAAPAGAGEFPGLPERFTPVPASVLDALAEAAGVAGEGSARYNLECLALRGPAADVAATDGRQVLLRGGAPWPWSDAALVRPVPLLAARVLPRDRPARVGRTATHVVLEVGPWTLWLALEAGARFPRVDDILPDPRAAATRLRMDPADAAILASCLDRLPGGDAPHAPATLDLNGVVAVRARGVGDAHPTEVVLARSRYEGPPVRVAIDRTLLGRALRLGVLELLLGGPTDPVGGRAGDLAYAWQPLGAEGAIPPDPGAIRLESTSLPPAPTAGDAPTSSRAEGAHPVPQGATQAPRARAVAIDLAVNEEPPGLIQEAVALHASLSEARGRASHLVAALRRERKRSRLLASTLAQLRELRLGDVAV